jgi:hypothetical protein
MPWMYHQTPTSLLFTTGTGNITPKLYYQSTTTSIYPPIIYQYPIWVENFPMENVRLAQRSEPIVRRPEPPLESIRKARALLLSSLTEAQRKTLEERGWFVVEGGRSRSEYRIHVSSIVANIERLHDHMRLCAHCEHALPMYDHFLAQKLMLENDEDAFLAIANRHRG